MEKNDFEAIEGEVVEEEAPPDLADVYLDKLKRAAADFENFRNRTIKEMGQMYDRGLREAMAALLPVIDNFELALKSADPKDSFAKGVFMIQNQLFGVLDGLGVKKIAALGEKFDTRFHSAVSHVKDENLGEGVIVEELQAGYMHKDAVIRHSVVVVAN